MSKSAKAFAVLALLGLLAAVGALLSVIQAGLSARNEPTAVEHFLARRLRTLAIPRSKREIPNPVPATPEVLARARVHFADHCASCHGNDGRGKTTLGRNLYPKAPDMGGAETQSLADGEIFWTIKNGIRLTGMPAWGELTQEADKETWELVHFIRQLPKLTAEELAEMEGLNPKSREQHQEEEQMRRFLEGGDVSAPKPPAHVH